MKILYAIATLALLSTSAQAMADGGTLHLQQVLWQGVHDVLR